MIHSQTLKGGLGHRLVKIGLDTRYSAQHCQMTVPKFILVFLGSLGEIGGPVQRLEEAFWGQGASVTISFQRGYRPSIAFGIP